MASLGKYRVLDGGLATELTLQHHLTVTGDPLWSARVIKTNPGAISDVHTSYLRAGADFITTATYQASIMGFVKHLSVSCSEAEQLLRKAVSICVDARDNFWQDTANCADRVKPLVVGSLGPYGACQADCSEYSGEYVDSMSVEELINWHRTQANILVDAGVEMLAFETFPAQKEADAVVRLLRELPSTKAWISFSCKNGSETNHGEQISDATRVALASDQVSAVGINCTPPANITSLLRQIPDEVKSNKEIVIYPNSGDDLADPRWPHMNTATKRPSEYVEEWMRSGATWLGGCCCIRPEDIADIRTAIHRHLNVPGFSRSDR